MRFSRQTFFVNFWICDIIRSGRLISLCIIRRMFSLILMKFCQNFDNIICWFLGFISSGLWRSPKKAIFLSFTVHWTSSNDFLMTFLPWLFAGCDQPYASSRSTRYCRHCGRSVVPLPSRNDGQGSSPDNARFWKLWTRPKVFGLPVRSKVSLPLMTSVE